jgi:hypothetical protein
MAKLVFALYRELFRKISPAKGLHGLVPSPKVKI